MPARRLSPSVQDLVATCQPTAASNTQPQDFLLRGVHASVPLRSLSLSGGGAARELATHERRIALVVVYLYPMETHCIGETPLFFGTRPCCDVASRGLQHTPGSCAACTRAHHCASCFWGGGTERELATRARRTALVVVGTYPMKGHCASERALSFGARPWCDLPIVASNTQPAFTWRTRERATALALSGEEAQYASL